MRKIGRSVRWVVAASLVFLASEAPAAPLGFAAKTLHAGLRVSGGAQNHLPKGHSAYSDLEYVSWAPHLSYFPRSSTGHGWWEGMPEVAVEVMLQRYERPEEHRWRTAHGARGALRYHFLALGNVVPYVEATVGAAATDLKVKEIRSSFTFVLEAGAGVSMELSGGLVVSVGYRFHHLSNAGLERPNRGINADSLVVGFSLPVASR